MSALQETTADLFRRKVNTLQPLLQRNGFISKTLFTDFEEPQFQQLSLLVGSLEEPSEASAEDRDIVLIEAANPSEAAQTITAQLTLALEEKSYKVKSFAWGSDISTLKGKSCIALMELEKPLLSALSEQDFNSMKQLILEAASTLWVVGLDGPSGGMISGLARVVRNETPGISFRTLHADLTSLATSENLGALITRVFQSSTPDDEFMVKDGVVHVSRIEEDASLNEEIERLLPNAGKKIGRVPIGQTPGPVKLCVQTPGILDSLCFEPDDFPQTELGAEQIEIQVKATALKYVTVFVDLALD